MKILVDADACPVVKQVEKIAKKLRVPVILLCDTNHILSSNYSEIKVIGAGADAVDIALANLCQTEILLLRRITELRLLYSAKAAMQFISREKYLQTRISTDF